MNGVLFRIFGLSLALIAFSACTTAPAHRAYTDTTGLIIGKTTPADCKAMYGEPKETKNQTNAEGQSETYVYVKATDSDAQWYARALFVEFKDGVLNGYWRGSSFHADRSTFAVTNVAKIEFATSTKDEVRQLLGNPHGTMRCPSKLAANVNCKRTGREIWMYADLHPVPLLPRGFKHYFSGSICEIVFDNHNMVIDMAQTSASN
jgi:hypothetical protein